MIAYLFLIPKSVPLLPSVQGWRAPATFGAGAVIGNLCNRLNYSIPDLVIGKWVGAAEVGLYSRGNGLVSIFQQIFGPSISYTALQSGYTLAQPALMAIGRPYLSSLYFGVSALLRLCLIFGSGAHDLWGIALALCAADVLTMLVPVWLMRRFLGYSYSEAWKAHWCSVRLCLFMLLFLLGAKLLMPAGWPDLLKLSLVGVMAAVSWFAGIVLVNHPVLQEVPAILRRFSRFAPAKRLADALELRCAAR